jgi:hypothetical protein
MPPILCPACSVPNPATYTKCRSCNAPLAAVTTTPDPTAEPGNVWRDQKVLVFEQGATLPQRCVRCNEPSEGSGYRATFYWHEPALYLLILCGLLVYFIVALIVRKRALVFVGLCPRHAAQRKRGRLIGGFLLVVGLLFFPVAAAVESGGAFFGWTGLAMILAAAVLSAIGSVGVRPQRIDDKLVRLKGVNADYLARLPSWGIA